MVKSKGDESEDGPPDTNYLGCEVATLNAKVTTQTYQPVTADASQEDNMEVWCYLFLGRKCNDFALKGIGCEDISI